jgi:hypothetical protein
MQKLVKAAKEKNPNPAGKWLFMTKSNQLFKGVFFGDINLPKSQVHLYQEYQRHGQDLSWFAFGVSKVG